MEKINDVNAKYEDLKKQYLHDLTSNSDDKDVISKALECALDTRKFEITLYWKRAAYFWAFIGAIFTAYFALQKPILSDHELLLGIIVVGYIFTWCWYLVNRGSKYWQENWEMHVDMLEDSVMGSLHKTVKNPRSLRFYKLFNGYPFSVTKINQVLNVTVLIVWAILFFKELPIVFNHIYTDTIPLLGLIFLISISIIISIITRSKLPRHEENSMYTSSKSEIVKKYSTKE